MSFHIQRSGEDRLNIITAKEEIKNVKAYGKLAGKMAKLMGIAAEIQGDDKKLYYVNLRSLGKAWERDGAWRFG